MGGMGGPRRRHYLTGFLSLFCFFFSVSRELAPYTRDVERRRTIIILPNRPPAYSCAFIHITVP